jgi:hypothetical protein
MNKITPIALIVTGGLSASANAAIVTQNFNALPSASGTDITIGAAAGPQYKYSAVSFKGFPLLSLDGVGSQNVITNAPGAHTMPDASSYVNGSSLLVFNENDYMGLRFNIGSGVHYGVVHFGARDADGLIPLVDVEYDDVAAGAVPEPAAWAMLIGGFGAAGAAARRSRRREKLATA